MSGDQNENYSNVTFADFILFSKKIKSIKSLIGYEITMYDKMSFIFSMGNILEEIEYIDEFTKSKYAVDDIWAWLDGLPQDRIERTISGRTTLNAQLNFDLEKEEERITKFLYNIISFYKEKNIFEIYFDRKGKFLRDEINKRNEIKRQKTIFTKINKQLELTLESLLEQILPGKSRNNISIINNTSRNSITIESDLRTKPNVWYSGSFSYNSKPIRYLSIEVNINDKNIDFILFGYLLKHDFLIEIFKKTIPSGLKNILLTSDFDYESPELYENQLEKELKEILPLIKQGVSKITKVRDQNE